MRVMVGQDGEGGWWGRMVGENSCGIVGEIVGVNGEGNGGEEWWWNGGQNEE